MPFRYAYRRVIPPLSRAANWRSARRASRLYMAPMEWDTGEIGWFKRPQPIAASAVAVHANIYNSLHWNKRKENQ